MAFVSRAKHAHVRAAMSIVETNASSWAHSASRPLPGLGDSAARPIGEAGRTDRTVAACLDVGLPPLLWPFFRIPMGESPASPGTMTRGGDPIRTGVRAVCAFLSLRITRLGMRLTCLKLIWVFVLSCAGWQGGARLAPNWGRQETFWTCATTPRCDARDRARLGRGHTIGRTDESLRCLSLRPSSRYPAAGGNLVSDRRYSQGLSAVVGRTRR